MRASGGATAAGSWTARCEELSCVSNFLECTPLDGVLCNPWNAGFVLFTIVEAFAFGHTPHISHAQWAIESIWSPSRFQRMKTFFGRDPRDFRLFYVLGHLGVEKFVCEIVKISERLT